MAESAGKPQASKSKTEKAKVEKQSGKNRYLKGCFGKERIIQGKCRG